MKDADGEHARQILYEAFTAGWQAALAVNITNPHVLAVIESCFEQWLREATDEADVLGLLFWGREDLPRSAWSTAPAAPDYAAEVREGPDLPYPVRESGEPSDVAHTDGRQTEAPNPRFDEYIIDLGPKGDEPTHGPSSRGRGRRGRRVLELVVPARSPGPEARARPPRPRRARKRA